MSEQKVQTIADQAAMADANVTKKLEAGMRRRRPLLQYVIRRAGETFVIERSTAGSKPSHALIFGAPTRFGQADKLETARELITSVVDGARRLPRRKDDRADVVEVWV
jgi:hypothetical protein